MVDDTFLFRVFCKDAPEYLETWRPAGEGARWDRHYLLTPGHSLRLTEGRRVELRRMRSISGLRTEQTLLSTIFPLDWMGLACIDQALPASLRGLEVDGRSAQTFVDSLAVAGLPQASVLTRARRHCHGTTLAEIEWVSVPEWTAETVSVQFESGSAPALRAVLAAAGLGTVQHRDLEDWLRSAHREHVARNAAALRVPAPEPGKAPKVAVSAA
jgi:hypothetical protein